MLAALLAAAASAIIVVLMRGGADQVLTALFFDSLQHRFPLRDAWAFSVLGHTALKWLMVACWTACLALGPRFRQGALDMALIAIVVTLAKHSSPFSCPWDLPAYGGASPSAGGCLPATHPLTGFALFGLYFALRSDSPRAARAVLAAAWAIGLLAGAVQIARGAHFASHVLWTAWVAWAVAWAADEVRRHGSNARAMRARSRGAL
jgi:membrane-associated PAP2 superfamily phosphatase